MNPLAVALGALLTACGGGENRSPARDAGAPGNDAAVAADANPGACAPSNLAACAYRPTQTFTPMSDVPLQPLSYMDATGAQRTFEVAIRRPMNAPTPMPVVIWSHGGFAGMQSARNVGAEWAEVFNRAGYLVIAVAHAPRSEPSRLAVCTLLGISATDCARFKYLHYDRPYDIRRVLDWLEAQSRGAFAGLIDMQRILYAGHSAGSGGTSMVAGASRVFGGIPRTAPDPRPRAFIGFSIEGPLDDGFTDESFAPIARPHLSVTGVGDTTSESDPAQRRRVFDLVMPGQKYRFWMTDPAAQHGTFDHNVGPCEDYQMRRGQPASRCTEIYAWMESAVLAFADAQLRESAEAAAWLASDRAAVLSNNVVEWSRR